MGWRSPASARRPPGIVSEQLAPQRNRAHGVPSRRLPSGGKKLAPSPCPAGAGGRGPARVVPVRRGTERTAGLLLGKDLGDVLDDLLDVLLLEVALLVGVVGLHHPPVVEDDGDVG